jgi:hypothetical protein
MPTYPNEQFPSNATVEALDGTTDTLTGLPYVPKGVNPTSTPSYEVQYNRRLHRQNTVLASWRQGMVADEGSLMIGVYPIDYTLGGQRKSFAGATNQAVPDDSTRYVYLDSANTLQIQSAWPTDISGFLALAEVATAAGVTTITDKRVETVFFVAAAEPTLDLTVNDGGDTSATVTVQVQNNGGTDLAGRFMVRGWLSDNPYETETSTTPDTGFSVPASQSIKVFTTDEHLLAATDANGEVVFTIGHVAGAQSWEFNAEVGGRLVSATVSIT